MIKIQWGSQYWTFSSRYQWVATLTCRAARQIADFYSLLTEWWSEYWIDLVHWPFAGLNSKHLTIGLFEYQTSPVFGSLCLGLYLVQYSNAFEYWTKYSPRQRDPNTGLVWYSNSPIVKCLLFRPANGQWTKSIQYSDHHSVNKL